VEVEVEGVVLEQRVELEEIAHLTELHLTEAVVEEYLTKSETPELLEEEAAEVVAVVQEIIHQLVHLKELQEEIMEDHSTAEAVAAEAQLDLEQQAAQELQQILVVRLLLLLEAEEDLRVLVELEEVQMEESIKLEQLTQVEVEEDLEMTLTLFNQEVLVVQEL
jgi:proline dehydrogenase